MMRMAFVTSALTLGTCLLSGCSGYVLKGKVIEGPRSQVLIVKQSDPRLGSAGVPEVSLRLTLEPQSLGRKVLASEHSTQDGTFALPVGELGAGVLDYEFAVLARAPGYSGAEQSFRLPAPGKCLLIILAPGQDPYGQEDDPVDDARRLLRQR